MLTTILVIFIVGYLAIALEHPLKIDKTASALLLGMLMWVMYALGAESIVPTAAGEHFKEFLSNNPALAKESLGRQALEYVLNVDIVEHLGDISQTLFFLLGAMTIVELIDVHGGYRIITDHITTKDKRRLLWTISFTTFFLSAILDNLTTTIVMIMLLRKLVADKKERWLYASMIVIAANSGGSWSPIGDVTTIMLWVHGNVTAMTLLSYVLIPSLFSMLVPLFIISKRLNGKLSATPAPLSTPPSSFVGMLFILGALWVFTEIFYNSKMLEKAKEHRLPKVIAKVDMPSILFFLGILMAVAVLQSTGVLSWMATLLDEKIHNIYVIDLILGILSSMSASVPLVAGVMGMYPVSDPSAVGYASNFVIDGTFWELLSYCAGVGGSILIIGSAAGVIAMGLEKINFGWYLKNVTWLAFIGYLSGVAVYMLEKIIF